MLAVLPAARCLVLRAATRGQQAHAAGRRHQLAAPCGRQQPACQPHLLVFLFLGWERCIACWGIARWGIACWGIARWGIARWGILGCLALLGAGLGRPLSTCCVGRTRGKGSCWARSALSAQWAAIPSWGSGQKQRSRTVARTSGTPWQLLGDYLQHHWQPALPWVVPGRRRKRWPGPPKPRPPSPPASRQLPLHQARPWRPAAACPP